VRERIPEKRFIRRSDVEKKLVVVGQSVVMTGIQRSGRNIELDDESPLPVGTRLRMLAFVSREEPPNGNDHSEREESEEESFARLEEILSRSRGRPIHIPRPE
jgi:hypothetical protein